MAGRFAELAGSGLIRGRAEEASQPLERLGRVLPDLTACGPVDGRIEALVPSAVLCHLPGKSLVQPRLVVQERFEDGATNFDGFDIGGGHDAGAPDLAGQQRDLADAGSGVELTHLQASAIGLLDPDLIDGLNGRPLATLPLHLIGHSRGGSVVTEIARSLGKNGVWVDHVTTLDPVPVAGFGDAAVTTWENVLYADNFYQQLGSFLIPTGQAVKP